MHNYQYFFFDMDGVIWKGDEPIQRASDTINQLIQNNKKIIYITNNSTKSRKSYIEKLKKFNLNAEIDNVYSSSSIAAFFLKNNYPNTKCYVIGMSGICEELQEQ